MTLIMATMAARLADDSFVSTAMFSAPMVVTPEGCEMDLMDLEDCYEGVQELADCAEYLTNPMYAPSMEADYYSCSNPVFASVAVCMA